MTAPPAHAPRLCTGRVLRVDLSTGILRDEPLRTDWAELYVGGKGLLLRYLFDLLGPGVDALGPDNPLILFTGPFAGTAAPTCSRLVVGCLSPATHTYLDSYTGGSFGPELKFAGFDGVVIEGRAPSPVVLVIRDGTAELRPADPYWGMTTSEIETSMGRDVDPAARVLSTGPARRPSPKRWENTTCCAVGMSVAGRSRRLLCGSASTCVRSGPAPRREEG